MQRKLDWTAMRARKKNVQTLMQLFRQRLAFDLQLINIVRTPVRNGLTQFHYQSFESKPCTVIVAVAAL